MSVANLADACRRAQAALVEALQAEFFADDLTLPAEAFGWTTTQMTEFFESEGKAPATSPAPLLDPGTPTRKTILLLGDSLTDLGAHCCVNGKGVKPVAALAGKGSTQGYEPAFEWGPGWAALLTRDYQAAHRADVINRGFGGYNSRWMRQELGGLLKSLPSAPESVAAVTILLGSNDQAMPPDGAAVPLDEYRENLLAITAELKRQLPTAVLFLLTPPPADGGAVRQFFTAHTKGIYNGGGRSAERIAPYAQVAREVAEAAGVTCVDLHQALLGENWQKLLADGLHFTGDGQLLMYKQVATALDAAGLAPGAMPRHLPHQLNKCWPTMYDEDGALRQA